MAGISKNIDMLSGSIWDKMFIFALPLALTGVLQQLYNMAMRLSSGTLFPTRKAVAAVGNNIPVIGFIVAFCIGLSLGANVVVERCLGMKNETWK